MKVLVTGADGFVGRWLLPALESGGHEVVGAVTESAVLPDEFETVTWDLGDADSISRAARSAQFDAVIHLAAVASGRDARADIAAAWEINTVGTARLAQALVDAGNLSTRFLYVSTAEVYGVTGSTTPIVETDPVTPCSPYAASKLGGEIAALEYHRRTGMPVIVARAFPHSGRGQDARFVVPAFARRLLTAKREGAPAMSVGNMHPVRDILHVSDVVAAYVHLVERGVPGETYNVASGEGYSVGDLLERMCAIVDYRVVTEVDPSLVRPADIPYLVGNATKLRDLTGWGPNVSLGELLSEVVDAQAN
ncbi:MAG: GDP-mannose 4,6-dehydratase [Gemmatimonadales bacterium]